MYKKAVFRQYKIRLFLWRKMTVLTYFCQNEKSRQGLTKTFVSHVNQLYRDGKTLCGKHIFSKNIFLECVNPGTSGDITPSPPSGLCPWTHWWHPKTTCWNQCSQKILDSSTVILTVHCLSKIANHKKGYFKTYNWVLSMSSSNIFLYFQNSKRKTLEQNVLTSTF